MKLDNFEKEYARATRAKEIVDKIRELDGMIADPTTIRDWDRVVYETRGYILSGIQSTKNDLVKEFEELYPETTPLVGISQPEVTQ